MRSFEARKLTRYIQYFFRYIYFIGTSFECFSAFHLKLIQNETVKKMKLNKRFQLRLSTKINKLETNHKATIRCFVSINGEKEIPFSTGCQIEPSNWSQDAQRIVGNLTDENLAINDTLAIIDGDLRDLFNEMKARREPFTTRMFLDEYVSKSSAIPNFIQVWQDYLNELSKNVDEIEAGTLCKSTFKKYERCLNKFKAFIMLKYKNTDLMPYAINKQLLSEFYEYLCQKRNFRNELIEPSGAYRDMRMLEKVLEFAIKKDYIKFNPFSNFLIEVPPVKQKEIRFLNEEELMLLYHAPDLSETERFVVDGFIFMAFSSLTYGDFVEFSRKSFEFIKTEDDAYQFIAKSRYKNRKLSNQPSQHVPLIRIIKEILAKYDYKIPVMANQTYNKKIKIIAHRVGIECPNEITTYVGRKSAATFYLNKDGVDIKTVAKIMGHKHESTTRNYYAVTKDETVKRQIGKLDL